MGSKDLTEKGTALKGDKYTSNEETLSSKSYFPGKCNKCGKKGQKATFCRSKEKSGNGKKFDGNCNWCGKRGHKERKCFAKQSGEPTKNTESSDNVEEEER